MSRRSMGAEECRAFFPTNGGAHVKPAQAGSLLGKRLRGRTCPSSSPRLDVRARACSPLRSSYMPSSVLMKNAWQSLTISIETYSEIGISVWYSTMNVRNDAAPTRSGFPGLNASAGSATYLTATDNMQHATYHKQNAACFDRDRRLLLLLP